MECPWRFDFEHLKETRHEVVGNLLKENPIQENINYLDSIEPLVLGTCPYVPPINDVVSLNVYVVNKDHFIVYEPFIREGHLGNPLSLSPTIEIHKGSTIPVHECKVSSPNIMDKD